MKIELIKFDDGAACIRQTSFFGDHSYFDFSRMLITVSWMKKYDMRFLADCFRDFNTAKIFYDRITDNGEVLQ
jgi:hypothetical protein